MSTLPRTLRTLIAAALLLAMPAAAVSTDTFKASTFADFDKGKPAGTLVSSEGEVQVGYSATALTGVDWPMLWSFARDRAGTVYFGTGDPGQLIAVEGDKVRVVADLKTTLVTTLAVGPGGKLIAGTMPDARVLSVDPKSGKWTQLAKLPTEHIWALHYDAAAKRIYAASGSPGKLFAIPAAGGKPKVIFDPGEAHLLCLVPDRRGRLLVGGSDKAILYRVSPDGRAEAVHDFNANELRDVVVTRGGTIYAVVNKFPLKTSGLPRYDRPKKGEGGTAMTKTKTAKKPFRQTELRPGAKVGKGALYRIDRQGRVEELLSLPKGYFTDLALDDNGQVWAADGTGGKVYLVRRDRRVLTAFDLRERQVLALAVSGKTRYLATGDAGAIYRLDEHAKTPAYLSQVFDAKFPARFGALSYHATGGRLRLLSRSGNTAKPDKTWSDWRPTQPQGRRRVRLRSSPARYLQIKAEWIDAKAVLRSFTAFYRPLNQRARVTEVTFKRKVNKKTKARTVLIEIKWKVKNPDKDELRYRLFYREETGVSWHAIKTPKPITKPKFEWDTEQVPDGRYRIKVVASDEAANGQTSTLQGRRISAPLLVDNRRPVLIGLTARYPWASGTARDSYSEIKQIAFAIDGDPWRSVDAGDGIYDSPAERFRIRLPRDLAPGRHVLTVRARDSANNVGVSRVRFSR